MGSFVLPIDGLAITTEYRLGNHPTVREVDQTQMRHLIFSLLFDLHPVEASIVYLIIFVGKSQEDIAKLFGVTQGAISTRFHRAIDRLRFLHSMPRLRADVLDVICSSFIGNQLWCDALRLMLDTTSYAVAARCLHISQGSMRQAYESAVQRLTKAYDILTLTPELATFTEELLEVYQQNVEQAGGLENIVEWSKRSIGQLLECCTLVTDNLSILAKQKNGIPSVPLVDLQGTSA